MTKKKEQHRKGTLRRWHTVEELMAAGEAYFTGCYEEDWKQDKNGNWHQIKDRHGKPVIKLKHIPGIAGLAVALGMDRNTFHLYCSGAYDTDEQPMSEAGKTLRTYIEHTLEKLTAEGVIPCSFGIFALKQFGWRDDHQFEVSVGVKKLEDYFE